MKWLKPTLSRIVTIFFINQIIVVFIEMQKGSWRKVVDAILMLLLEYW